MAKHTTPAKATGGGKRKQLSKSHGTSTHHASVPKAVRYKEHGRASKGRGNFSRGNPMFS